MNIEFSRRELVCIDMLVMAELNHIAHKLERDQRLFDHLDIDIHDRILKYQSKIALLSSIHETIIGNFPLE